MKNKVKIKRNQNTIRAITKYQVVKHREKSEAKYHIILRS